MAEFGIFSVLSPRMQFDSRMEDLFTRLREVVSWHGLSFLDEPLEKWWVYMLGLLAALSLSDKEEVLSRLHFTETHRDRMLWTYQKTDELCWGFFQLPEHRPSDIYRALQPFRTEELLFMMAKAQREEIRRAISHYFHRYRHVSTELKGKDLKELGVPPGVVYRIVLDELLDARLNGEVRNRQEELAYLRWHHPELFVESTEESRPAPAS